MGGRGLCPIVLVAEEDLPRRADRARLRPEQGSEGEAGAIGAGKNHILRLPHRDMLMGAHRLKVSRRQVLTAPHERRPLGSAFTENPALEDRRQRGVEAVEHAHQGSGLGLAPMLVRPMLVRSEAPGTEEAIAPLREPGWKVIARGRERRQPGQEALRHGNSGRIASGRQQPHPILQRQPVPLRQGRECPDQGLASGIGPHEVGEAQAGDEAQGAFPGITQGPGDRHRRALGGFFPETLIAIGQRAWEALEAMRMPGDLAEAGLGVR